MSPPTSKFIPPPLNQTASNIDPSAATTFFPNSHRSFPAVRLSWKDLHSSRHISSIRLSWILTNPSLIFIRCRTLLASTNFVIRLLLDQRWWAEWGLVGRWSLLRNVCSYPPMINMLFIPTRFFSQRKNKCLKPIQKSFERRINIQISNNTCFSSHLSLSDLQWCSLFVTKGWIEEELLRCEQSIANLSEDSGGFERFWLGVTHERVLTELDSIWMRVWGYVSVFISSKERKRIHLKSKMISHSE